MNKTKEINIVAESHYDALCQVASYSPWNLLRFTRKTNGKINAYFERAKIESPSEFTKNKDACVTALNFDAACESLCNMIGRRKLIGFPNSYMINSITIKPKVDYKKKYEEFKKKIATFCMECTDSETFEGCDICDHTKCDFYPYLKELQEG